MFRVTLVLFGSTIISTIILFSCRSFFKRHEKIEFLVEITILLLLVLCFLFSYLGK